MQIQRLTTASLFRLCLFGWGLGIAPIAGLASIASLMGFPAVHVGDVGYSGVGGFFVALLAAPLIGLQMAVLNVLVISTGWYLYRSIFRPRALDAVPLNKSSA